MFCNWLKSVIERLRTAFTLTEWLVLLIGLIGFFGWAGDLSAKQKYIQSGVVMLLSATIIFPTLLCMKRSRLTKGYSLVAFGAIIVLWHAWLILKFSDELNLVANETIKVLVQMFTLASAGAGGSIIAADGDRHSTDREVQVERITITTDTQRIIDLHKLTLKQTRWIKTLCILSFLVLVLVSVVLSIVLLS